MKKYAQYFLPAAFVISLAGVSASLLLSSEFALLPCELCWWARILFFPVPVILGVGLLSRDKNVYKYVLPLLIMGALVTLYHSLLQWGIIEEGITACQGGVSCSEPEIMFLGVFTIPFGAFLTNFGLIGLMVLQRREGKKIKSSFKQQLDLLVRLTVTILIAVLVLLVIRRIV